MANPREEANIRSLRMPSGSAVCFFNTAVHRITRKPFANDVAHAGVVGPWLWKRCGWVGRGKGGRTKMKNGLKLFVVFFLFFELDSFFLVGGAVVPL